MPRVEDLVRSRAKLLPVLAAPLVFGLGFLTATVQRARPAEAAAYETSAPPPTELKAAGACVDDEAMNANANLVRQLRELSSHAREIEAEKAAIDARETARRTALPSQLHTSADEWKRMRQARMLRLKTPCASWGARQRLTARTPSSTRMMGTSHGGAARARAEAAGLSQHELGALDDAYARAHARTWAKMRASCTESKESEDTSHGSELARVTRCLHTKLSMRDPETQRAIERVAELRAAGADASRASTDAERVLAAMAESADTLVEEMVHVLGREKASRALDYGVVCLDESTYWAETPKSGV